MGVIVGDNADSFRRLSVNKDKNYYEKRENTVEGNKEG